jgi:extracellular elastinolytic metalloproteinase
MIRQVLLSVFFGVLLSGVSAQSLADPKETALQFLREKPAQFGLNARDVADLKVTDVYTSRHNGVTHVWVQQQYQGIPVFNGLFGLHLKQGQVYTTGHRFTPNLDQTINTTLPSMSAAQALQMALMHLGFEGFKTPGVREKINERNWVFEGGAVSKTDIPVSICYAAGADGKLHLAWTMIIDQANSADLWNLRVDAVSGQVIDKINQTVYCKAGHAHHSGDVCADLEPATALQAPATVAADETYRVFPLPTESPAHGPRQLLVNPADPNASPYGWLDVNGVAGPDYTYTRGNNVWAYDDIANDNTASISESAEGGASTNFDFPFDPDAEPAGNREAAIANLFYMNNAIHDITYRFGFDEPSGNFQINNYGNGGLANDAVRAEGIDGGGTDNANFSTPVDGQPGRMQMYKWNRQGGKLVKVNAPNNIVGSYAANSANGWGANVNALQVTADVVLADDGSQLPTQGCFAPVADVTGKIVLVDRGGCEFGRKALNVEEAGGVGCIICNFEDVNLNMGPGAVGAQVTIPVVAMTKSNCNTLRQFIASGLNITIGVPAVTGPDQLDGDFDNGIIAHEYGHGVSTRLTGGPSNSGCLGNAEQMGEGWSDWLTLVTTVKPGDTGAKKRGVGTYVEREDNDGQGIRRYPYSTDMGINPITFSTVAENTEVHAIGEIWTAMTWDLYWAMVEKYGFDADLSNTNSGNFRAIQLVMDGMKFQPCSPGFQDGRDAIMLADILNYNGADTCLISSVFARRGLGYFASQGTSANAADGTENFDPIPTCVKELKIKKITTTPLIDPGGQATYVITVTNHKDATATGVVISDELPAGMTLVSASNGGTQVGNQVVWNIGNMNSGQVLVVSYTTKAADGLASLCYFRDPMDDDFNWVSYSIETSGTEQFFTLQTTEKKVGTGAWKATALTTDFTDFVLEGVELVEIYGAKPVLRFWHNFNTEAGSDAGLMEVQIEGETTWRIIPSGKVLRNPYSGKVQYGTFTQPNLYGFSGNSNGWIQSYIDMSDYIGKKVYLRFRFGTDDNTGPANGAWLVDEFQLIDMVNFESQACVASAAGDLACASLTEAGVILNTACTTIDADEPASQTLRMTVQPNPAQDVVSLTLNQAVAGDVRISLIGTDGRLALQRNMNNLYEGQVISLGLNQVPAGAYYLRVESAAGQLIAKLIVQ